MEMHVAKSYVSRILKELNRQRDQIDQAIKALEAIEREQPRRNFSRKRRIQLDQHGATEKKNGTTGEVVPFVRPN